MKIERSGLWLCADCTIAAVNGEVPTDATDERCQVIDEGLLALGPHLVVDFDPASNGGYAEDSAAGCDCCGSRLAGDKYRFAVMSEAGGPATAEQTRIPCPACEGDGQSFNDEGNLDGVECETCGGNGDIADAPEQLELFPEDEPDDEQGALFSGFSA